MEEKYGQAQRVWVMDRGMVSEKNIAFLRARGARSSPTTRQPPYSLPPPRWSARRRASSGSSRPRCWKRTAGAKCRFDRLKALSLSKGSRAWA